MFLTCYFFQQLAAALGHSAMCGHHGGARSLCYWNPMTGELRNVIETDMAELAKRASVSVRTVKDVLNNELVKQLLPALQSPPGDDPQRRAHRRHPAARCAWMIPSTPKTRAP